MAAAGFWFWGRSRQLQEANGQKALLNAKQSLSSGNLALAQKDLQSVYSSYGSTEAGVESAMLLTTIAYDNNKPQDGITLLEKTVGSRAASTVQGTIRSLEGDGYAQLGKLTDAAKQYQQAADATTYPLEKGYYQSKAARGIEAAGDSFRRFLVRSGRRSRTTRTARWFRKPKSGSVSWTRSPPSDKRPVARRPAAPRTPARRASSFVRSRVSAEARLALGKERASKGPQRLWPAEGILADQDAGLAAGLTATGHKQYLRKPCGELHFPTVGEVFPRIRADRWVAQSLPDIRRRGVVRASRVA